MPLNSTILNLKCLLVLAMLLCFKTQAQDTIYKRNGNIVPAKIIEVGVRDVSYRRLDNPDGPLFIATKNEIAKIRYANGHVDTFTETAVAETKPLIISPAYPNAGYDRVEMSSKPGIFVYNGRLLSDRNLLLMAETKNLSCKNAELRSEIEKTRNSRNIQYIAGFGGMGLGIVGLYSFSLLSSGSNSSYNSGTSNAALLLVGVNVLVAAEVVSGIFKSQRSRHAVRVAQLYNNCR